MYGGTYGEQMIYKRLLWTAPELLEDSEDFYRYHFASQNSKMEVEQLKADTRESGKASVRIKNSVKLSLTVFRERISRAAYVPTFPKSKESDVWAFGITMCQIITRSMPFEPYIFKCRRSSKSHQEWAI